MHRQQSIYSKLYVENSFRAEFTPRVTRKKRPRVIAWAGPAPFFRNRFYELDSWYKARIQRPEILPQLHIIDPDLFQESFEQKMTRHKEHSLDIGFRLNEPSWKVSAEEKARQELQAIRGELLIDLAPLNAFDQPTLIDHFHVFEDMFVPGVFFHNIQPLDICWSDEESPTSLHVLLGNVVKAEKTSRAPSVRIGRVGEGKAYSTLLMLNLEGPGQCRAGDEPPSSSTELAFAEGGHGEHAEHVGNQPAHQHPDATDRLLLERMEHPDRLLLHWLVANIPDQLENVDGENVDGKEEKRVLGGDELVPYLQPVPFLGTGYHRVVFLLMRHREPLVELEEYRLKAGENSLLSRGFNLNAFYKRHEQLMTPSALRFCQIKWDPSCDRALHDLGLKAPKYWYDWNEPLRPEQREFPKKPMPFNHYLNMFRCPKDVRREVQNRRLEKLVKLKPGERLEPTYPDIFYRENRYHLPEFEHERLMGENSGRGVWSALYNPYENPAEQHEMEKWAEKLKLDKEGEEGEGRKKQQKQDG